MAGPDQDQRGITFPAGADGRRSTSAFGRTVVADALAGIDPVGAAAANRETNWRQGYLEHFRRLVEAGLPSADAALRIATDGLGSIHRNLEVDTGPPDQPLVTEVIAGTGDPDNALTLPYRGSRLAGDDLRRRVDLWVEGGVVVMSV